MHTETGPGLIVTLSSLFLHWFKLLTDRMSPLLFSAQAKFISTGAAVAADSRAAPAIRVHDIRKMSAATPINANRSFTTYLPLDDPRQGGTVHRTHPHLNEKHPPCAPARGQWVG